MFQLLKRIRINEISSFSPLYYPFSQSSTLCPGEENLNLITNNFIYFLFVFPKEVDAYKNEVTKIARPMPIEYFLIEVGAKFHFHHSYRITYNPVIKYCQTSTTFNISPHNNILSNKTLMLTLW